MNPAQLMGDPVTTQPSAVPPEEDAGNSNYFLPPMAVPAPIRPRHHENIIGPIGGENAFGGRYVPEQLPLLPLASVVPPQNSPHNGQGCQLLDNGQGCQQLESLHMLDRVVIKQKVGELDGCWCKNNTKYIIEDVTRRQLFTTDDNTDNCCTRNFCGSQPPSELKLWNSKGQQVIQLDRPWGCNSCFCPCWLQSIDVYAPLGTLAGRIVQQWSFWGPSFKIVDDQGKDVYSIEDPQCTSSCCGNLEFRVKDMKGGQVGKIEKNWGNGSAGESLKEAENVTVSFPSEMDLKMKAVFIGAAFLLDFMYFETKA